MAILRVSHLLPSFEGIAPAVTTRQSIVNESVMILCEDMNTQLGHLQAILQLRSPKSAF